VASIVTDDGLTRLLKLEDSGDLALWSTWMREKIPPYAILSHRWGTDNKEVTFKRYSIRQA
jgi:hypothetical protein